MAFANKLRHYVDSSVRYRGDDYWRRGTVELIEGDGWEVRARVRGTELYDVHLHRENYTLFVSCTCLYFTENDEPCKHVWATIRKADAAGLLRGNGDSGPRALSLHEDAGDAGRDADDFEDEIYDGFDDLERGHWVPPYGQREPSGPKKSSKRGPRQPSWKESLGQLRANMREPTEQSSVWPAGRELLYFVDVEATRAGHGLVLQLAYRERKKNGDWSKPKTQRLPLRQIEHLPDPADRQILAFLSGPQADDGYGYHYNYYYYNSLASRYHLQAPQQAVLMPLLCQTGRCRLRVRQDEPEPRTLHWDDGPPWEFWLALTSPDEGKTYRLVGTLRREGQEMPLSKPVLLVAGGLVFWDDFVGRLNDFSAFAWIGMLRDNWAVSVPAKQRDALLQELLQLPRLPRLTLPPEL
ncbi:MAG TPA: SWIM zinc finger family protein, partial [Gemmataceae bacterium]|nr:SWIM zinc finger family protein [Gemmataceae bacterium]